MARSWDKRQLIADGFELTYADVEWHDGPRKGLSLVDGVPHYCEIRDGNRVDEAEEYVVWPASEATVAMEREQWAIFIRYQLSDAGTEEHPGHGGIDVRYDEPTLLLAPRRQAPDGARRLIGEARFDDGDDRYRFDGVDHWFRWRPAE
ncbi:hypothetical protein OG226_12925 [Streptomyces sp. NBC_01261]|uniref:hypothetical protein n=1 Tax=unclassified Streptomyces TaxID=2593676 RepID=UPI002E2C8423|nr:MULTISPECIES: hypothetical protein [unclassified Streptomyces]